MAHEWTGSCTFGSFYNKKQFNIFESSHLVLGTENTIFKIHKSLLLVGNIPQKVGHIYPRVGIALFWVGRILLQLALYSYPIVFFKKEIKTTVYDVNSVTQNKFLNCLSNLKGIATWTKFKLYNNKNWINFMNNCFGRDHRKCKSTVSI